ncbi:hypothetical protein ISN45_Aa01g032440 [Arabidopsis thaliana x Arabidopsis arenosa]|uniref:Uncharacterized protein n=1 Tax=Arabidopsis thaliana x Arabidopsis arenosa TaxID=1240361 RepID=A0A8T2CBW7_9BRAS|nr:hypothetical protein ISN45_Aa01g032440 [Arabidopsis thaliana x Arabidopsis arenosa]
MCKAPTILVSLTSRSSRVPPRSSVDLDSRLSLPHASLGHVNRERNAAADTLAQKALSNNVLVWKMTNGGGGNFGDGGSGAIPAVEFRWRWFRRRKSGGGGSGDEGPAAVVPAKDVWRWFWAGVVVMSSDGGEE